MLAYCDKNYAPCLNFLAVSVASMQMGGHGMF